MNVNAHMHKHLAQGAPAPVRSLPASGDLDAARRQGLEEARALLNDASSTPEGESEDFERGWQAALELVAGWLESAANDA